MVPRLLASPINILLNLGANNRPPAFCCHLYFAITYNAGCWTEPDTVCNVGKVSVYSYLTVFISLHQKRMLGFIEIVVDIHLEVAFSNTFLNMTSFLMLVNTIWCHECVIIPPDLLLFYWRLYG